MRTRADRHSSVDLVVVREGPVRPPAPAGRREPCGWRPGGARWNRCSTTASRPRTSRRDNRPRASVSARPRGSRPRDIELSLRNSPVRGPSMAGGSEHPRPRQRRFRGSLSQQDAIDVALRRSDRAWPRPGRGTGSPLDRRGPAQKRAFPWSVVSTACWPSVVSDLGIRDLDSPRLAAFENLLELASHAGGARRSQRAPLRPPPAHRRRARSAGGWRSTPGTGSSPRNWALRRARLPRRRLPGSRSLPPRVHGSQRQPALAAELTKCSISACAAPRASTLEVALSAECHLCVRPDMQPDPTW